MSSRLNIPNVSNLNTEGVPFSTVLFLQAVEEALKVIDDKAVYKTNIDINVQPSSIKAASAQGQAFSISGLNVASGVDYAALVSDFKVLLESHNRLQQTVSDLIKQLKGT